MAKNDKLINSLRLIAAKNREQHVIQASERDTPAIYAAIAIALHRLLLIEEENKIDAINTIFAESQEIWEECLENGIDMRQFCLEETGIDIMGKGGKENE